MLLGDRARAVVVAPRLAVHARESRASGTTTHRDDVIALETDDDVASRAREVSSSDARGGAMAAGTESPRTFES
tara:strand:- start:1243 stop:1464 length:222 start_codon:yes stop_codon:yes gene_type:complete